MRRYLAGAVRCSALMSSNPPGSACASEMTVGTFKTFAGLTRRALADSALKGVLPSLFVTLRQVKRSAALSIWIALLSSNPSGRRFDKNAVDEAGHLPAPLLFGFRRRVAGGMISTINVRCRLATGRNS